LVGFYLVWCVEVKLTCSSVAAGFDAAAGDELGGCFVTPACYAHMTHMLMTLANGKVAVCLEVGSSFVFRFPSACPSFCLLFLHFPSTATLILPSTC
jgi:hypothetical protein